MKKKISKTCLSNERFIRSIEHPISDLVDNIKERINSNEDTRIKCHDDLVINIIKTSISNVDKSKCQQTKIFGNRKECTDNILTTILMNKICHGQNQCQFSIEKDFASFCPCYSQKYLDLTYTCVKPSEIKAKKSKKIQKRWIRLNYTPSKPDKYDNYKSQNYNQNKYRVGNSYKHTDSRKASNPAGYEGRKNQYLNKASDAHYKKNYPKDNYSDMKVGSSRRYKKKPTNNRPAPANDDYYYDDYYYDYYYGPDYYGPDYIYDYLPYY